MIYDMFVNSQFYKTFTTENGYDFSSVMKDLEEDRVANKLAPFLDETKRITIKIVEKK